MSKPSRHQLAEAIVELSVSTAPAQLSRAVAAYLMSEGRTRELGSLMRDCLKIRENRGITEATVTSAFDFHQSLHKDIDQLVTHMTGQSKQVIINHQTEPAVLGGVRIRTAQLELDATLRGRLKHITQTAAAAA